MFKGRQLVHYICMKITIIINNNNAYFVERKCYWHMEISSKRKGLKIIHIALINMLRSRYNT